MMKKMLAIILFLAVFSSFFALQGAASEEEFSDEETKAVITAAVNAHKLYALAKWRMVDAIVTPEDESAEDRIQNAIMLDPVFSELIENDKLYRKADFGFENDYVYYYRAKESIGSLKDLQMFFDRRFTDFDVETQYPNKLYFFDGNRLYLSTNTGFWGFGGCEYFDYASLSVKRIDSDHAVVVIPHKNGTYPEENYYEDTLFIAKTETGWKAESVNPANAPETGDNTAVFAVCSVVSLAVLAAVCVKASRRRRETA